MVRVVLLSSDTRLVFQLEGWLREFASGVKLEKISSLQEFALRFESAGKGEAPGDEDSSQEASDSGAGPEADAKGAEAAKANRQSEGSRAALRLVIVDADTIKSRALQWIIDTKKMLRTKGTAELPPRVMVLSFEGGQHSTASFVHEAIDDLVLKPVDKALFLQKVELLIAETAKVKPSFLFRQKTDMVIEAGKDVLIDEISEFALAIRNPAPLAAGVYATIHSSIFGQGAESRVICRVYESLRHPTFEGQYLVRLSFFGISAQQILNVKKFERQQQSPARAKIPHSARKLKAAVEAPPVLSAELVRIAVIDMNPNNVYDLKSALTSNFKGVDVRVYASYNRFLGDFMRHAHRGATNDDKAVTETVAALDDDSDEIEVRPPPFPRYESVAFLLSLTSHEFLHFETPLRDDEMVLGYEVKEWKERSDLWTSLIEKEDREEFDEFVAYAASGAKGRLPLRVRHQDSSLVHVEAIGQVAKSGDEENTTVVRVEVKEITVAQWQELSLGNQVAKDLSTFRFDAIFIDGGMIRTEATEWLEGLHAALTKAGVLIPGVPSPKVFVMADEHSLISCERFRSKDITDFFYKNADRKYLVQKVKALVPKMERVEEPETPPFVHCEVHGKLAKEVKMVEIAEYGLGILHPAPIREQSVLRFFSQLFGDDPDGIIARCTYSERKEGERDPQQRQDAFYCNFVFYGASEELLRRIRSWIREDYVHHKKED